MSVQEILAVIDQLPPEQQRKLYASIDQRRQQTEHRAGPPLPMEFQTGEVTYDRIKHLAGSLEGPGDVLSNPTYMDDFGQRSLR